MPTGANKDGVSLEEQQNEPPSASTEPDEVEIPAWNAAQKAAAAVKPRGPGGRFQPRRVVTTNRGKPPAAETKAAEPEPAGARGGHPAGPTPAAKTKKIDLRKFPHFPRPPRFKATYQQLFKYWKDVWRMPLFRDRILVYGYRLWPVIDRTRTGKDYSNIDKLTSPIDDAGQEIASIDGLYHLWGAGDYHLKLNDTVHQKTVCMTTIREIMRDKDTYPPVLDLAELDTADPANASYVQWLRLKGVQIPGVLGINEQEDEEMGPTGKSSSAVSELARTVTNLADKSVQIAREAAANSREAAEQRPAPVDTEAARRGMEIVQAAADMGNQIVQSAIKQVPQHQQANPVEQMRGFVELAKELRQPQTAAVDTGDKLVNLMNMFMERETKMQANLFAVQQSHVQALEKRVEMLQNPATREQPKSMRDLLFELRDAKAAMEDIVGGGDDEPGRGKGSGFADYVPMIVNGLTLAMGLAASMVHNWAVGRAGRGQTIDPQQVAQQVGQVAQDQPAAPLPSGKHPGAAAGVNGPANPYHALLTQLREPLLQSLDAGETGGDFAAKLIDWQGVIAFESLRGIGKDALLAILSNYPPIWQVAQTIPERFEAFLDEFLEFDYHEGPEPGAPPAAGAPPREPQGQRDTRPRIVTTRQPSPPPQT